MGTTKQFLDTLSCDAIEMKPRDIDWSETLGEDMEGWTAYEAFDCDECGREVVVSRLGEDEHRYIEHEITVPDDLSDGDTYKCHDCGHEFTVTLDDEGCTECPECSEAIIPGDSLENRCTGYLCFEGPMMNYWYPVRIDDCEEAARAISHLPLCVVEFKDGQTGLALTGGGMDLSWEICRAFIALGYMPPLHFCDLPDMAGMKWTEETARTVAACKASARVAAQWAGYRVKRLGELEKKLKSNAA